MTFVKLEVAKPQRQRGRGGGGRAMSWSFQSLCAMLTTTVVTRCLYNVPQGERGVTGVGLQEVSEAAGWVED